MKEKIDPKILEILDWIESSIILSESNYGGEDEEAEIDENAAIKLVLRWSNTLANIFNREFKKKNLTMLSLIIKQCEFLSTKLIDVKDDITIEKFGPNILDSLLKLKDCFELYEDLNRAPDELEVQDIKLSSTQRKSLEKILQWNSAYSSRND